MNSPSSASFPKDKARFYPHEPTMSPAFRQNHQLDLFPGYSGADSPESGFHIQLTQHQVVQERCPQQLAAMAVWLNKEGIVGLIRRNTRRAGEITNSVCSVTATQPWGY